MRIFQSISRFNPIRLPARSNPNRSDTTQKIAALNTTEEEYPTRFVDHISFELMTDPVVCSDGRTYDRSTALQLTKSPFTQEPLIILVDNIDLRSELFDEYPHLMRKYQEDSKPGNLFKFFAPINEPLGLRLGEEGGKIKVIEIFKDSCMRHEMRIGDEIVSVNGRQLSDLSVDQAVNLIKSCQSQPRELLVLSSKMYSFSQNT